MGSSGGDQQKEAEKYENERQARIQTTQRAIDKVFGSPQREADIQDFLKASRGYYREDVDRQQGDAARALRFALARSGQTGGQYDVDQNSNLARAYQRGVLEADRRAQSAASSLRAADQSAKLNLFAMASQGLDSNTALNQAAQSLRTNLEQSRADAREGSLGDLFSGFGKVYQTSIEQDEARRAQRDLYRNLYAPTQYGQQQGFGGGY